MEENRITVAISVRDVAIIQDSDGDDPGDVEGHMNIRTLTMLSWYLTPSWMLQLLCLCLMYHVK